MKIKVTELPTDSAPLTQASALRRQLWIEKLSLPIQWIDLTPEQVADPLSLLKLRGDLSGVLLPATLSPVFMKTMTKVPAEVVESGFADGLMFTDGAWWLRCYLKNSLRELVMEKAPQLDTHAIAYVTGSDVTARLAVVTAIQMGFRRITMIARDQDEVRQRVSAVTKLFFDLDLRFIKDTDLTSQPSNGSLLLNTLSVESAEPLLEDLAYLNFLKKDGLVVDLPFSLSKHPLLDEALHVGIRQLDGVSVWGARDFSFLQALLGASFSLSREEYLSQWQSLLKSSVPQSENETKV